MPVYEYRCAKGHTFEAIQSMSDDPLTNCTTCSSSVQRVFHPVAVHFKGSGFYTTDYGRKKGGDDKGREDKDATTSKSSAEKGKEKPAASSAGDD
jgi:putative FmdB family regulatory protein